MIQFQVKTKVFSCNFQNPFKNPFKIHTNILGRRRISPSQRPESANCVITCNSGFNEVGVDSMKRNPFLHFAVSSLDTLRAIGFAFFLYLKSGLSFTTMKSIHRGNVVKKPNDSARLVITSIAGVIFGYLIGVHFPYVALTKINLPSSSHSSMTNEHQSKAFDHNALENNHSANKPAKPQIYASKNPRGAESLPPGIVVPQTDLFLRRLWGDPAQDLKKKPKYLVTFTVGWDQRDNIDASVKKFSDDFQILLFHYDGRTTEWDQYEWSKDAIHVSVERQTKWWYAKRFLHPDVVAAYDYIFIWDEDLGVEHFNGDKYIELVKKHGLEISQPGLEPNNGLTWQMTKRRGDKEVHKDTEERPGWCIDPHLPPCAAFVEIMAPVFSREAWWCVWYMIQNDLVHGWGLDFALRRCVEPAHEKIGVVDSQWIVHQVVPTLGIQGQIGNGKYGWQMVKERCKREWIQFHNRLVRADRAHRKEYITFTKTKNA